MIHVYNFSGTNWVTSGASVPDGADVVLPYVSAVGLELEDGIGVNTTVIVTPGGLVRLDGNSELFYLSSGMAFAVAACGLVVGLRLVRRGMGAAGVGGDRISD